MTRSMPTTGTNDELIPLQARCESRMRLDVCNGCGECWLRCAKGVPATSDEWQAIKLMIAEMSDVEWERLEATLAQCKEVNQGDGVFATMCRYFDMDTGGCVVYPARPLACRLLGHVEWMPCPIDKVPTHLETPLALELMSRYAERRRQTFEEWEAEDDKQSTSVEANDG